MEHCPKCETVSIRYISDRQSFYGEKDWDSAHYNQAFGREFKSNHEMRKYAKERGMIEIGTESVEKINKKFDKERQDKSDKAYNKAFDTCQAEVNSR
jgi:ssDNA-binding Zn-finger/Zn-ribbon topoisomerase 1